MSPLLLLEAQRMLKIAVPEFKTLQGDIACFSIENALNELSSDGYRCLLHVENPYVFVIGIREKNHKATETGDIKYSLFYKKVSSQGEEVEEINASSHQEASKILFSRKEDTLLSAIVTHARKLEDTELDSMLELGEHL